MNRRKAEWKHIEKERRETGRGQNRGGSKFGMTAPEIERYRKEMGGAQNADPAD